MSSYVVPIMTEENHKRQLIERYLEGKATDEELMAFFGLINSRQLDALIESYMDADIAALTNERPVIKRLWPRIAAAASILLALSAGGYFFFHKPRQPQQIAQNQPQDIAPGHNQATLTLANGQKIVLTKGLHGQLAQQGTATVQVNNGNAIAYTANANATETAPVYNTLTTVRGEQSPYPLVLADGTKIWLDAASSVTFPTAFVGKERLVKITGQAYFEVTHDAAHPFKVMVKGQTIEDLGTTFNINAYDDEPTIQTTLISGKIRLTNSVAAAMLRPGQVAIVSPQKSGITVKDVDTEGAIAWKNGYFLFEHESLESAMRKISRWYDVEVVYPEGKVSESYVGSATRYGNVSGALRALEMTGDVRFKIEGRKIIVLKKQNQNPK